MSGDGALQPHDRDEIERLVREAQDGRHESFQRLFDRYFGPVTHYFANQGLSAAAAEDLAQDALVRVYRKIGTFRFEASFETWFFKIASNLWKNALRSRATVSWTPYPLRDGESR